MSPSGWVEPSSSERLTDTAPNDSDAVYGGAGFEVIDVQDGDGDDYVDCGPDSAYVYTDKGDVTESCFVG